MACLQDDKSVMCLISAGRAFHSPGPATEKALSPNVVLVRGMSYSVVIQSDTLSINIYSNICAINLLIDLHTYFICYFLKLIVIYNE